MKHPLGQEASPHASAFLGKYASTTAVDLIQRKKLDFWNFYGSQIFILYCFIRIMTVRSTLPRDYNI